MWCMISMGKMCIVNEIVKILKMLKYIVGIVMQVQFSGVDLQKFIVCFDWIVFMKVGVVQVFVGVVVDLCGFYE